MQNDSVVTDGSQRDSSRHQNINQSRQQSSMSRSQSQGDSRLQSANEVTNWKEHDKQLEDILEVADEDVLDNSEMLGKVFCTIRSKKGVSCINIWYPFIAAFIFQGSYGVYGLSAQLLMRDPKYFNLTINEVSDIITTANTLSTPIVIFLILFVGMIYDVVGRRITLTVSLLVWGGSILYLPHTAPNKNLFIFLNILEGAAAAVVMANPLQLDYASQEEQGKMGGLVFMGVDGGMIYGLTLLLMILSPYDFKIQFAGIAAPVLLIAILTPFMVIEPPDLMKKKRRRSSAKRYMRLSKIGRLRKNLALYFITIFKAFRLQPKLFIAVLISPYMSVSNSLFTLWIQSKYIQNHPDLSTDDQKKGFTFLIQYVIISGCIISVIFIVLIGKMTDVVSPKIMIVGVSVYQGAVAYFCSISTPGEKLFYVSMPLYIIGISAANVISGSYINKYTPVEVRGSMLGIKAVWGQVNSFIYMIVLNIFYKKNPVYPWYIVAIHYGVFTVIFIILGCVGLIDKPVSGKKKLAEEEEDEDDMVGSTHLSLKESLTLLTKDNVDTLPGERKDILDKFNDENDDKND